MSEAVPTAEGTPAAEEVVTKRKYVRLSNAVKSEALVLWRTGEMSCPEIAKKLGVPERSLRDFFDRSKAKKGKRDENLVEKRAAVVGASLTLDPMVHAQRVFDTKNETYRITEMLRKLVATEIITCKKNGSKLGTIQNEIKTIREAAAAIKTCREEAYAVLGIRPEDMGDEMLPDLQVVDLTEDDIADLQAMPPLDDMGDVPGATSGSPEELDPDEEGGG